MYKQTHSQEKIKIYVQYFFPANMPSSMLPCKILRKYKQLVPYLEVPPHAEVPKHNAEKENESA